MGEAALSDTVTSGGGAPEAGPAVGGAKVFASSGYALFVLFVGSNAPSPLYRGYSQRFGFSPLVITLIFAVYMAFIIPSLLLFGPLSDAIGPRRVLVPGLVLAALGAATFAAANATGWLFAARAIQGVSMGACSGALTAAMAESEPRGDRRRAVLVATGCIVAGAGFGPLFAGVLAQYAPWPNALVYLVVVAALVPAVHGVTQLPRNAPTARWRPRRPHVPRDIVDAFLSASTSSFLAWAVTGLFLSLVPSYALALSDSSNLALAGAVVALLFASSAVVQLGGHSLQAHAAQRHGLACLATGLALLVLAGERRSLPLLLAATTLAGLGQGLAFMGAMADIGRIAPPDRRADIASSFYVVTYVGTGAPVIGVGLLATHTTLLRAVEVFAAVLIVLCVAAVAQLAISARRTAATTGAATR